MTDIEELKRLAEEQQWTGDWYDAGCGTVHCTYVDQEKFGDYGEIAHPEPSGVAAYIAAASPKAILALIRELEEARKDAERWRYVKAVRGGTIRLDRIVGIGLVGPEYIYWDEGKPLDPQIDAARQQTG